MSRIAIAIGLPDTRTDSPPSLIYLGRSGAEMRRAVAESTFPRHIEIPFAVGIPKHNAQAAANAALARAVPAQRGKK